MFSLERPNSDMKTTSIDFQSFRSSLLNVAVLSESTVRSLNCARNHIISYQVFSVCTLELANYLLQCLLETLIISWPLAGAIKVKGFFHLCPVSLKLQSSCTREESCKRDTSCSLSEFSVVSMGLTLSTDLCSGLLEKSVRVTSLVRVCPTTVCFVRIQM